jgi:hypothetical protein
MQHLSVAIANEVHDIQNNIEVQFINNVREPTPNNDIIASAPIIAGSVAFLGFVVLIVRIIQMVYSRIMYYKEKDKALEIIQIDVKLIYTMIEEVLARNSSFLKLTSLKTIRHCLFRTISYRLYSIYDQIDSTNLFDRSLDYIGTCQQQG